MRPISPAANEARAGLPLEAMLTAATVRARVPVESWQEAVQEATRLLVDTSAIEPRYGEAIARVLREMGPYAVLAPGIVLLHARPEDGVRRPCLAVLTLLEPVAFGHSANDPVDLVIAFGAVDKEAHLDALQQLAALLSDVAALAAIRAATSDRELLNALRAGTRDRMGNGQ
jgi:mannitol/fructose-specific phosphotransferase system IIA component (Ntr-type)